MLSSFSFFVSVNFNALTNASAEAFLELTYAPINSNIVVQEKVYLPADNVITEKEEEMPTEEYIKLFLKCEKKQKINLDKHSDGSIELTVENEMNPIAVIDRPAETRGSTNSSLYIIISYDP